MNSVSSQAAMHSITETLPRFGGHTILCGRALQALYGPRVKLNWIQSAQLGTNEHVYSPNPVLQKNYTTGFYNVL